MAKARKPGRKPGRKEGRSQVAPSGHDNGQGSRRWPQRCCHTTPHRQHLASPSTSSLSRRSLSAPHYHGASSSWLRGFVFSVTCTVVVFHTLFPSPPSSRGLGFTGWRKVTLPGSFRPLRGTRRTRGRIALQIERARCRLSSASQPSFRVGLAYHTVACCRQQSAKGVLIIRHSVN